MKLCSACLLGIETASHGGDFESDAVKELAKDEVLIPVCPEQLGGLPTPRPIQEIQGASGEEVLDGEAVVENINGEDKTEAFIRGARETLKVAELYDIDEFISKSESPSCGCGKINDGSFSESFIEGDGVATALLKRHGIHVRTERSL